MISCDSNTIEWAGWTIKYFIFSISNSIIRDKKRRKPISNRGMSPKVPWSICSDCCMSSNVHCRTCGDSGMSANIRWRICGDGRMSSIVHRRTCVIIDISPDVRWRTCVDDGMSSNVHRRTCVNIGISPDVHRRTCGAGSMSPNVRTRTCIDIGKSPNGRWRTWFCRMMSSYGRWGTCVDFGKDIKKQQRHEGFAAFWLVWIRLSKPFSLRSLGVEEFYPSVFLSPLQSYYLVPTIQKIRVIWWICSA